MIWKTALPTSTNAKNPMTYGDTRGPSTSFFCSASRRGVRQACGTPRCGRDLSELGETRTRPCVALPRRPAAASTAHLLRRDEPPLGDVLAVALRLGAQRDGRPPVAQLAAVGGGGAALGRGDGHLWLLLRRRRLHGAAGEGRVKRCGCLWEVCAASRARSATTARRFGRARGRGAQDARSRAILSRGFSSNVERAMCLGGVSSARTPTGRGLKPRRNAPSHDIPRRAGQFAAAVLAWRREK
jgi:hypothetical protein